MTIKKGFMVTLDVFSSNDFYVLEKVMMQEKNAGAALKLYDRHIDFLEFFHYYSTAFEKLIQAIRTCHQDVVPWLLLSAMELPDSRIVRHKKLWKSFVHPEMNLPKGERSNEYMIEHTDAVSFYGGILFDESELIQVAKLIGVGQYGCIMLTSNKNDEVNKVLQDGWGRPVPHGYGFPKEIINFSCLNDVFFLRPIGAFDDREWGAVALAQSTLIKNVFIE